jgi:hypothetical protein
MPVPFPQLFEPIPVLLVLLVVLFLLIPANEFDPFQFADFVDDDSPYGE